MRRTKRTLPNHAAAFCRARDGMYLGNLKRFFVGKLRQDGRNRARKHGFFRSRRTDQQDIVTPCNRYLGGSLCALLSLDLAEVCTISLFRSLPLLGWMRKNLLIPTQMRTKLRERIYG